MWTIYFFLLLHGFPDVTLQRVKSPFLFVKVAGFYFVLLLDGITYNICSIKNRTIFLPNVEKQKLMFKKAVNSCKEVFIFVIKLHILWRLTDFRAKMLLLNISYEIYRPTTVETVPVFLDLSYFLQVHLAESNFYLPEGTNPCYMYFGRESSFSMIFSLEF